MSCVLHPKVEKRRFLLQARVCQPGLAEASDWFDVLIDTGSKWSAIPARAHRSLRQNAQSALAGCGDAGVTKVTLADGSEAELKVHLAELELCDGKNHKWRTHLASGHCKHGIVTVEREEGLIGMDILLLASQFLLHPGPSNWQGRPSWVAQLELPPTPYSA